MKNIKTYFTALTVVLSLVPFFSSCDKDRVDPPARTVEIDTVYSLRQVKDLASSGKPYTFEENAATYAVVTMDESQGNIYKQLYVQDSTDAILLVFNDKSNLKVGDSVRIDLKGTTVEISHSAYQISTLSASKNTVILAKRRFIEPQLATLEQINSRLFTSQLVKVDGVEFRENDSLTWGDYLTFDTRSSLRNLFDCHDQTLLVLTSGHATFAAKPLPKNNGSMIVIASIYDGTMQLLVRDINEVDMRDTRCDGSGGEGTLLSESFETGQGDFTVFNKTGEKTWEYNAAATSMQIGKIQQPPDLEANEDWLISPAIDFSEITADPIIIFQHTIVKDLSAIPPEYMKTHQTVWFSFDYTSGDPNNVSWTQIPLSDNDLPSGKNWLQTTASLPLPNSVLGQKKVHVAYKYTCEENEPLVWRIYDVLIKGKK